MKVLFATGNRHKVSEANQAAAGYGVEFVQVDCPYPEKRSESVSEVAEDGAAFVYAKLKKPVVVEDSGLFIQALDDFPGPYSAYVFKRLGNYGILRLLEGVENRRAFFRSCVAYSDGREIKVFEGVVEGAIAYEVRGEGGFGYDPIFTPKGYEKTFAEDHTYKLTVSHRRKAVDAFCRWLSSEQR